MDIHRRVKIGSRGVNVTPLGFGTAPLGYLYSPVDEDIAVATMVRAYQLGIRWFDTAPLYGQGVAETRLGLAMKTIPRDIVTIATKVGYVVPDLPSNAINEALPQDFSYDGVLRSFEASLGRLDCGYIDILQIHDPDNHYNAAMEGAYHALRRLLEEGVVRAIGVGMNQSALLARFAQDGEFDSLLVAGRYTLLDQSALDDLMPVALKHHVAILVGGVFNSGILADPWAVHPTFNYGPANEEWIHKARALDQWCRHEGIPLKAAALQFPFGHAAVAGVLIGARTVDELEENVEMAQYPILEAFWQQGKVLGFIRKEAPIPR